MILMSDSDGAKATVLGCFMTLISACDDALCRWCASFIKEEEDQGFLLPREGSFYILRIPSQSPKRRRERER